MTAKTAAPRLDLLLLHPPNFIRRDPDAAVLTFKEDRYLPLGGMYLASYLSRRGRRVMLAPLGEFYQKRGSYLDYDDGTELAARRFAEKTRRILAALMRGLRPAAVGITLQFAMHHRAVEILLRLLRERYPGMPVLLGGNHATFTARSWLLRADAPDWIVLGEGEIACQRLLDSGFRPDDYSGLAARLPDGRVVVQPGAPPVGAEDISHPMDLKLAVLPPWTPLSALEHFVTFSRGCNWRCSFCASPAMWGRQRQRDADAVALEIKNLHRHGVRDVVVIDDTLIPSAPSFALIADVLRRFPDVAFTALLRLDLLNRTPAAQIKEANIRHILVGVESFSPHAQEAMNKRLNPALLLSITPLLRRLRDAGLKTSLLLLVGHPGSRREDDLKTVRVCRRLARAGLVHDLLPCYVAPFPGTALAGPMASGYRILLKDYHQWTLAQPIIELRGPDGRVSYSARDMRASFTAIQAIRAEHRMGPWRRSPDAPARL